MKRAVLVMTVILGITHLASGQVEFSFVAKREFTDSVGRPANGKPKPMPARRITYKNKILSITANKKTENIPVLRVIAFTESWVKTYALEVQDKSGMYIYYIYAAQILDPADGPIAFPSLVIPNIVNGNYVSETTYLD